MSVSALKLFRVNEIKLHISTVIITLIILTDSMVELAIKSEQWNGKSRLAWDNVLHPFPKTSADLLSWTCKLRK